MRTSSLNQKNVRWIIAASCAEAGRASKARVKSIAGVFYWAHRKNCGSARKNLLGWSEIREGGLASSAALMNWIGAENHRRLSVAGARLCIQANARKLAPEFRARVHGGQANLRAEYVPNLRQVEYMMLVLSQKRTGLQKKCATGENSMRGPRE